VLDSADTASKILPSTLPITAPQDFEKGSVIIFVITAAVEAMAATAVAAVTVTVAAVVGDVAVVEVTTKIKAATHLDPYPSSVHPPDLVQAAVPKAIRITMASIFPNKTRHAGHLDRCPFRTFLQDPVQAANPKVPWVSVFLNFAMLAKCPSLQLAASSIAVPLPANNRPQRPSSIPVRCNQAHRLFAIRIPYFAPIQY
jgi:hypothetical protein